jgi:hypothetical protein
LFIAAPVFTWEPACPLGREDFDHYCLKIVVIFVIDSRI